MILYTGKSQNLAFSSYPYEMVDYFCGACGGRCLVERAPSPLKIPVDFPEGLLAPELPPLLLLFSFGIIYLLFDIL